MPLSEHEQQVLRQMEQALYAEDPRLATQLKKTSSASAGPDRRRLALGVLAALVGLAIVVGGVMSQFIWLGAIGFLVMVLGAAYAATPGQRSGRSGKGQDGPRGGGGGGGGGRPTPKRPKPSGSFMDRMEQQWDKRREQGPF